MSKILEALDNAQADAWAGGVQNEAAPSGPAAPPDGASGTLRFSRVSMEEEMIALRQRLDALLPDRPTRAIEFIGSREGEGTSTVVEEFARHSATRFDQRVLLLKMDLHGPAEGLPGAGSSGAAADAMLRTPGGGTLDVAPLPQVFLAASHAEFRALFGDLAVHYHLYYTLLFMWSIVTFDWEPFLAAAALDPERFDRRFWQPWAEISRRNLEALAAMGEEVVFVHDDLATSRGPVFCRHFRACSTTLRWLTW